MATTADPQHAAVAAATAAATVATSHSRPRTRTHSVEGRNNTFRTAVLAPFFALARFPSSSYSPYSPSSSSSSPSLLLPLSSSPSEEEQQQAQARFLPSPRPPQPPTRSRRGFGLSGPGFGFGLVFDRAPPGRISLLPSSSPSSPPSPPPSFSSSSPRYYSSAPFSSSCSSSSRSFSSSSLSSRFSLPSSLPKSNTGRMFLLVAFLLLGGFVHYLWKAEAALSVPWIPDAGARLFSQRPLPAPVTQSFLSDGEYELPLRTKGRDIVDQKGRRFKLASVNWYGASDELFIPGGLDIQHRATIAATIRTLGFNSVRLPYSDEMVMVNPPILPHLLAANPDLIGLRALDVFEAVVDALTEAGVAVIINNHITSGTWCCGADPCDAGWQNDHLGPLCRVRQTEDDWIAHWETVMARLVANPRVIGADLRNEVRGVWGTMTWDRWASAAERAGNALLKIKPDWLIIVGGTESGNDLVGVAKRPVVLDVADRVVYSAHVYSWSGWGSVEGRYSKRSYPSFVKAMRHNWAYLVEGNMVPVWIGEFGAPHHPGQGDANYWQNLLRYLKAIDADFGYWAINPRKPRDDEKESYSLVEDDWITPILDYRMRDMTELMRD